MDFLRRSQKYKLTVCTVCFESEASLDQFLFRSFLDFQCCDQFQNSKVAGGSFWYCVWKFSLTVVITCVGTYYAPHWPVFERENRNSHIWVLVNDEERRSISSKHRKCEKTWLLKKIFHKFHSNKSYEVLLHMNVDFYSFFIISLHMFNCSLAIREHRRRGARTSLNNFTRPQQPSLVTIVDRLPVCLPTWTEMHQKSQHNIAYSTG